MNWPLILLICAVIYGIIFLSGFFVNRERLRTVYLDEIKKWLGGTIAPLEQYPNSFKLDFVYENVEFTLEDIIEPGIKRYVYRIYLKAKTKSKLELSFTEKERSELKSDIMRSSDIPVTASSAGAKVVMPAELRMFNVITNSPARVNALFTDEKVYNVMCSFRNPGLRGHPSMSFAIHAGTVVLEFHESGLLKPNVFELQDNYTVIEKYLDKLLILINKLNELKWPEQQIS